MRNTGRHVFTMIELLIVIAIITILAALLLPALSRAVRTAREVSCANNIKQVGVGILMYAGENRRYYPDRSKKSCQHCPGCRTYYRGRCYQLLGFQRLDVNKIYEKIEPYHGDLTSMGQVYTCPFVRKHTIDDAKTAFPYQHMGWQNARNEGKLPDWYPNAGRWHWSGRIGNYNLFFGAMWKGSGWGGVVIREPMRKLGEKWRAPSSDKASTRNKYCNVLVSDRMRNNQFTNANANHPPLSGTSHLITGYGPGYFFNNSLATSASYLRDDGSLLFESQVSQVLPHIGGSNSYLSPSELYSDSP